MASLHIVFFPILKTRVLCPHQTSHCHLSSRIGDVDGAFQSVRIAMTDPHPGVHQSNKETVVGFVGSVQDPFNLRGIWISKDWWQLTSSSQLAFPAQLECPASHPRKD